MNGLAAHVPLHLRFAFFTASSMRATRSLRLPYPGAQRDQEHDGERQRIAPPFAAKRRGINWP